MRVGIEWGMFRPHSHSSYLNLIATAGDPNGLGAFCAKFLSLFFSLNLLLAAFNLLPAPPLDGSRLPLFFLRGGMAENYWLALQSPIFSWGGLFVAWKLF